MKKLFFRAFFLTLVCLMPVCVMAEVSVHVNIPIPLPPPIVFPAPPEVVVVPGTDVYVVPDLNDEIFFYSGWWWRPWQGHWYRSRYYDRGWGYYRGTPTFHRHFYHGWRDDYRNHRWKGQPWEYHRIHHGDLNRNWRDWERTRYWHRPPPPRHHRPGYHGGGPGPGHHPGYHGGHKPGHPSDRGHKPGRHGDGKPGKPGKPDRGKHDGRIVY